MILRARSFLLTVLCRSGLVSSFISGAGAAGATGVVVGSEGISDASGAVVVADAAGAPVTADVDGNAGVAGDANGACVAKVAGTEVVGGCGVGAMVIGAVPAAPDGDWIGAAAGAAYDPCE